MKALEIKGLKKSFGNLEVIKDLDMNVPEGSIYGFLGKNGAGKTTTMKIITGLINSNGGEITIFGEKIKFGGTELNHVIGYLPDAPEFYGFMTAKEYLKLCADICKLEKSVAENQIKELLQTVGLEGVSRRIKTFSRGMKQRLGIAQALIGNPKIIFCDEPTSALDPDGRREFLDILKSLKGKTTIVFSTHILSDVERICDVVGVINQGKMAIEKPISQLRDSTSVERIEIELYDNSLKEGFINEITGKNGIISIDQNGSVIVVTVADAKTQSAFLCKVIAEQKLSLRRLERIEQTLEDIFKGVTGK